MRRTLQWNVRGAVQKGWSGDKEHHDGQHWHSGEEDEVEEQWDIDTDVDPGTDSGVGPSEAGDSPTGGSTSPLRRQLSLLNM